MKPGKWGVGRYAIVMVCAAGMFLVAREARARSNIFIGDLSVSYNFTERDYADGAVVAENSGDRREYTVSPRLTWSSRGETDLFELSYAPGFMYDDLGYTTRLDHSFILRAEKQMSRRWSVSLDDTFFLGDDPVREEALATTEITAPDATTVEPPPEDGAPVATEDTFQPVDERVGTREYWRNTASLQTGYSYGQGRQFTTGYTLSMLRNNSDSQGGYTEYDRHEVMARVGHRFDARWSTDVSGQYTVGLFKEPTDVTATGTAELSNDLKEYSASARVGYQWSTHATVFLQDSSVRTDYDSDLRSDSWAHNVSLGVDYAFDRHLSMSVGGGVSLSRLDGQSWDTDYNFSASLRRELLHASWSVYLNNAYDVQNFDGQGSGLTRTWEVGGEYSHRFSENLSLSLSAAYSDARRMQRTYEDLLAAYEAGAAIAEDSDYHEKNYSAGVSLAYSFRRWYSLSLGYRYAKYETDLADTPDYDEHRVFVQLTASKDFFRW
ncbi:outer membrane beta-barrel protein [Desulfolithobacter dissulfuricans]|nr:outer membrane beta-barrel protein [Desulfolithobacter dissulfuricans]